MYLNFYKFTNNNLFTWFFGNGSSHSSSSLTGQVVLSLSPKSISIQGSHIWCPHGSCMAFRNTSLHTGQTYLSSSLLTNWGNSPVRLAPGETREFSIINRLCNWMKMFYSVFPSNAQQYWSEKNPWICSSSYTYACNPQIWMSKNGNCLK